jgi:pyruvate/2-oxoglutarate dehydrogenase complex dihydrolipoamide acyltransferase (E2) component
VPGEGAADGWSCPPDAGQGLECRVEPRDMLSLSVLFDHDVIDGVPAAAFVRRLTELMEGAYGLGG